MATSKAATNERGFNDVRLKGGCRKQQACRIAERSSVLGRFLDGVMVTCGQPSEMCLEGWLVTLEDIRDGGQKA